MSINNIFIILKQHPFLQPTPARFPFWYDWFEINYRIRAMQSPLIDVGLNLSQFISAYHPAVHNLILMCNPNDKQGSTATTTTAFAEPSPPGLLFPFCCSTRGPRQMHRRSLLKGVDMNCPRHLIVNGLVRSLFGPFNWQNARINHLNGCVV